MSRYTNIYPIINTLTFYFTSLDVLNCEYAGTLEDVLEQMALEKARGTELAWTRESLQVRVGPSDHEGYAYCVRLANIQWVDRETMQANKDEAVYASTHTRIPLDYKEYEHTITFVDQTDRMGRVGHIVRFGEVKIHADAQGIVLSFDDYEDFNEQNDLLVIEMVEDHPRIMIWANPESEDPSHDISLAPAFNPRIPF